MAIDASPRQAKTSAGRRLDLRETATLAAIVTVYLILGGYYAFSTPLYSRPDEGFHQAYAVHLKAGNPLPTVDATKIGWGKHGDLELEAHQPPAYYATVAALASLFPPGRDEVPVRNPHFMASPRYNVNRWLPTYLTSPLLMPLFFTGRFVSLAWGLVAVLGAYLLMRLYLPWQVAATAAAFVAFNPQFLFIATSFSNDVAIAGLSHLGLWQVGLAMKRGLSVRRGVVVGLVVALATLTKLTGLGLLAPVGLVALWQSFRRRSWAPLMGAVVAGTVVLAGCSWWFWRNWQLYNDPFALNLFPVLLGYRTKPFGLTEFWGLMGFIWQSFWLDFSPGAMALAEMPVYYFIGAVCLLALAGLALYLRREVGSRPLFLLVWGWFFLMLLALVRLTSGTDMALGGGRLLLPASVAVGGSLAVGLWEVSRQRWWPAALLAVALAAYAGIAPVRYLEPLYPRPAFATTLERQPTFVTEIDLGDPNYRLYGYDLALAGGGPTGRQLLVTYYWQTIYPKTDRDYSLFLQLLDAKNNKLGQVDTYPAYGATRTRYWDAGQWLIDEIELPLPAAGKATAGRVITGLYTFPNFERPRTLDKAGKTVPGEEITLAELRSGTSGRLEVVVRGKVVAEGD